jgi:KDO2-lipid IV(A) lauroyltransferase
MTSKKITDFFSAFVFLLFVGLVALIPFRALYALSNFIARILQKVIKYRQRVIHNNIFKAELDITEENKEKLINKFYKNLADIILEGLKSFTMSKASVRKRHKVLNPEIITHYYRNAQSVILVTGHTANWEWGTLSGGVFSDYNNIVAFYSPLKNNRIDKILRWSRSRFGTLLTPTKGTTLTFEKYRNHPAMFIMAADQSPLRVKSAHWIQFLGRPTAFLNGPGKHAHHNNYPVIFAEIVRVKRGYYELTLSVLANNSAEIGSEEITRRYAEKLESLIRRNPSDWLWSHRRWKHKPA